MGTVIDCFWLTPTNEFEESLRRYSFRPDGPDDCKSGTMSYHNVEIVIGKRTGTSTELGCGADDFDHADSRWPSACLCGYVFKPEDHWQHNSTRLYTRSDTGELTTTEKAPPGAIYHAFWLDDMEPYCKRAPDGKPLMVVTPEGPWSVDGPASNSPGWTRTGTPPKLTVVSSILIGKYHAHLVDGRLVEC